MTKIVTPMDFAMASLRMWRIGAQHATLATMDMTEVAHAMVATGSVDGASSREAQKSRS